MTGHAAHESPPWPREHTAAPVESTLALPALGRAATTLEIGTELLAILQRMLDLRFIVKGFFFGSGLGLGF